MGKTKPRIKAGKGKKWKKGQSSSSNPETKKFREVARSRFFSPNLGTSRSLTVGALKTHDAILTSKVKLPTPPSEAETESMWTDTESVATTSTFKTFASDWSSCSNASFGKFLNNFQPTSALHKEMLAVLAAITEIIKSKDGSETSTEYFGALMSALDVSENEDSTAAIVSLLGLGIKSVPQEVLRARFSEVSKTLVDVLAQYSENDNFVIVRAVVGCLSVLLRAQDAAVWSYPSTLQVYQAILVFITFSKPKVRKAAQHAVIAILKASTLIPEEGTHPAAATTAKFCVQLIESSATVGGGTTTLHVVTFLKEVLSTFPKAHIKTSSETILKLLTLGNVLMTSCCFQALYGLFSSAPPPLRLTPTLNAQLIHALYDYQPATNDWQSVLSWLTVMQEAFCNLARIDPNLCGDNLVKLFSTVNQFWLCDNSRLMVNATCTLRAVASDCLSKCNSHPNFYSISRDVFRTVEEGLKYQYHNAWPQVLHLLAALFEVLGAAAAKFSGPCLKSLGDLRDTYNFTHTSELEYTVGKAVRTLGPEAIIAAIPLNITGKEDNYEFKRAWLLPIFKENIQASSLDFFCKYFLPLAQNCRVRSEQLKKTKDNIGSHSYELLCCQIWALFPSFCNGATDIVENFKSIAPMLGTILNDWKVLRLSILAALRKLITKSQESKDEESLKVLARYAKNYLPILLNVYTMKPSGSDEEGQRLATLDTIKVYLSISSSDLCGELYDKAESLYKGEKVDNFMKESVLDVMKALLKYLDESRIEKIYDLCISSLSNKITTHEEKKYYRLLENLCSAESSTCKTFLTTKIHEIQRLLVGSLERKNVCHAGARLRCLYRLVRWLPRDMSHVLSEIVPEAVLRCKDSNAKTRSYAYDLLTEIYTIMKGWSQKAPDDITRDYFQMLLGGLLGAPTLVSATILGMAKLIYTIRDDIPADIIELLLENIAVLLGTSNREITSSCLAFVKTFIVVYPVSNVLPHLPAITSSIVGMADDCKRHSRLKVRDILDRLLRKFGYETMKELIPESDTIMQKRLKNLKKINAKKRGVKDKGDDDLSDIDEQFNVKSKPKSIEDILASSDESDDEQVHRAQPSNQRRKAQMYIKEDEDDIVDLKSPNMACKLSATKPNVQTNVKSLPKKETSFKTSADGRLIIPRDIATEKSAKSAASDEDDPVDDVASVLSSVKIGNKRKMSVAGSVISEPPAKYQAGGKGIHRPVNTKGARKTSNENDGIKTGKEYRAKKAKGDVKIKGKPDPYAYIPLSRKMLNRRKKAKAKGKFKNIMKSSTTGEKGSNAKKRK